MGELRKQGRRLTLLSLSGSFNKVFVFRSSSSTFWIVSFELLGGGAFQHSSQEGPLYKKRKHLLVNLTILAGAHIALQKIGNQTCSLIEWAH